jgi:hypothetical protein
MSGQQVAQSFGPNMPSRIAGSAQLLLEPGDVAPVPLYQPLVPFYGSQVVSGGASSSSSSSDEIDTWKQFPGRLDVYSYQGDDVQIPLYFSDPAEPALDMSDENGCSWAAQVRTLHTYHSQLLWEFTIESSYAPPEVPADPTSLGVTQVTLFLPRLYNRYIGQFRWDVACTSPYSGSTDFPKPVDYPEDEPWPPDDSLRTWLYGYYYSVPRVTATDWLPPPGTLGVGGGMAVMVTPQGYSVGPNGRVP